jgi:hypothetical protein
MWHFKEEEEKDENTSMTAPGFILLASQLIKNKRQKVFLGEPTSKKRNIYDGHELLVDLRNDDFRLDNRN